MTKIVIARSAEAASEAWRDAAISSNSERLLRLTARNDNGKWHYSPNSGVIIDERTENAIRMLRQQVKRIDNDDFIYSGDI